MSNSWDRFTAFIRGFPNHHIYDESFKEYFYWGQNDSVKEVIDTIIGCSYGEYSWTPITRKWKRYHATTKLGAL